MADPASRGAKLKKLNDFRRQLPYTTARALSAVLHEVAQQGIPSLSSRHAMSEATTLEMNEVTPYGTMLVSYNVHMVDGSIGSMLAINPLALLYKVVLQGGSFTDLFWRCMAEKPCSPEHPWKLALYADEVVPGNVLSADNRRKIWVLYFSFLDFGPLVLQREESWLCNLAKRSSDVNKVAGGISQVFGASIKLFLVDPSM